MQSHPTQDSSYRRAILVAGDIINYILMYFKRACEYFCDKELNCRKRKNACWVDLKLFMEYFIMDNNKTKMSSVVTKKLLW